MKSINKILNLKNYIYFSNTFYGQILFLGTISTLSVILFLLAINYYFQDKIFPQTFVAGIDVSRLTKNQAEKLLVDKIHYPEKIILSTKDQYFELALSEIEFSYNIRQTVEVSFEERHQKGLLKNLVVLILSPFQKESLELKTQINKTRLDEYIQLIAEETAKKPTYPSVSYKGGEIIVERGSPGEEIDKNALEKLIEQKLSFFDFSTIQIPLRRVDPTISEEKALILEEKAKKLIGKSLNLINEYDNFTLKDERLISFLEPDGFKHDKILDFLTNEITPKVNRNPQNAVFRLKPAQKGEKEKVVEFIPAKEGLTVDQDLLSIQIENTLNDLIEGEDKTKSLQIPVEKITPKITTEKVNNLGIKELLGRGSSKFVGSSPSRIHNISLASSKFNGVLIAPNEIFSFNDTLGDVSVYTGYKQAYVIKDGKTVLGDGGGVCQVSTTLFRAVLNSGLPIIERRAHSYRVSYYEQDSPPGIDATVFSPTTDLKFKNDTPNFLLIQTQFDAKNFSLTFEIYGTKDGRVSSITKPVVTNIIPPPEDIYIDDPTLPSGQIKQIDYKAWGARVSFDYKVKRNQETIFEKTFVSDYRPWQAVFLRGIGPDI